MGTFEPDKAGTYSLKVENPAGDNRVFSMTKGSFLGAAGKFVVRLVIGGIVGVIGLVLLILGIVFTVRAARRRASAQAPANYPPPPPAG
ncbi:MAG: hypothetical protein GY953_35750 [bacterium]|nr:hypothetical protein [bacterium]